MTTLMLKLENGTIDAARFGHREHLQAAWEMLGRYPFLEACSRYADGVERLARAARAEDKFNLTLTLGFMSLIAERMSGSEDAGFDRFYRDNPDLHANPLLQWYSRARIDTPLARRIFLMPDRHRPASSSGAAA